MTTKLIEAFHAFHRMAGLMTPEVRRSRIRDLIKSFVNEGNSKKSVIIYPAHWLATRTEKREVGHKLAGFIKSQDYDSARDLLNEHEGVRDRWSYAGQQQDIADWFNETFPDAPSVFACDDCNWLEWDDDGHWANDGDTHLCDSCTSENYTWSDHQDTFISNEDWEEEQERLAEEDEEEQERDSVIGDYHSSKRILSRIPSSFDTRKTPILMGLELEMEVKSGDREEHAKDLINALGYPKGERYCAIEEDGSLHNGFELVTGWTGLDVHAQQLQHFKNPIRGLKSHDTQTCGLHVHICKKGMSLFHAVKMVLFINDSGNQRLVRSLARRDSSRYSQVKNKKAGYEWLKDAKNGNNLQHLNADRYEALNFQNARTVEFRMFKGTLRYETMMACLEFTYATWFFCRDTGTNQLTTENFLEFICKAENLSDTKFLRQYLTEKNWTLADLGKIKNNPRFDSVKQSPELATCEQ
jgi:hypothetical protein